MKLRAYCPQLIIYCSNQMILALNYWYVHPCELGLSSQKAAVSCLLFSHKQIAVRSSRDYT